MNIARVCHLSTKKLTYEYLGRISIMKCIELGVSTPKEYGAMYLSYERLAAAKMDTLAYYGTGFGVKET